MKHLNWHLCSSCQARCTARRTTSCSNINLDPLFPLLHLRGGRGPKIMAGFQQFRLGFNVARGGITGGPADWTMVGCGFHATSSKSRGIARQKATPPLGEKHTKIPGQDKLSRTVEEEDDTMPHCTNGEIFIARQIVVQKCRGWRDGDDVGTF